MSNIDVEYIQAAKDALLAGRQCAFNCALRALGVTHTQRKEIIPQLTMNHWLLVPPEYRGLPALRGQPFVHENPDRYVNMIFVVRLEPLGLELLKAYQPTRRVLAVQSPYPAQRLSPQQPGSL